MGPGAWVGPPLPAPSQDTHSQKTGTCQRLECLPLPGPTALLWQRDAAVAKRPVYLLVSRQRSRGATPALESSSREKRGWGRGGRGRATGQALELCCCPSALTLSCVLRAPSSWGGGLSFETGGNDVDP